VVLIEHHRTAAEHSADDHQNGEDRKDDHLATTPLRLRLGLDFLFFRKPLDRPLHWFLDFQGAAHFGSPRKIKAGRSGPESGCESLRWRAPDRSAPAPRRRARRRGCRARRRPNSARCPPRSNWRRHSESGRGRSRARRRPA